MKPFQPRHVRTSGIFGVIFGSLLIGIPLLPHTAQAQIMDYDQYDIYDEYLPGTTLITPTPGATQITPGLQGQQPQQDGLFTAPLTPAPPPPGVLQPPLPSTRQDPITYVQPTNGAVSVQLVNRTGVPIRYEAIQDTDYRILPTDSSVMLQGLGLPTTVALSRTDGGFIRFVTESQPGMLTLNLYPTSNFDDNAGAIRIQAGGAVYLN